MHGLDSFDSVFDQPIKFIGPGYANPNHIAIFASDAVQFFDLRYSREEGSRIFIAKFSLYEDECHKHVCHKFTAVSHRISSV